jgi:hypothetical protein
MRQVICGYNIGMTMTGKANTMRNTLLYILLAALLLSGCNLPTAAEPTLAPTADAVATQVSQLLTQMPTLTTQAEPENTPEPAATEAETADIPTDTPVPTAVEPTPTLAPSGPQESLGSPSWRDTLDTGKSFYQFETENTRVTHENGRLILSGLTANGWHGWSLTFTQQPGNFYIEAAMTPQACSGSDIYGLVFRAPDVSSGYFFGVTCDGRYNLLARDFEDGMNIPLVQLTSSDAIQSGADSTNRLGIMAQGDRFALYVNGTLLREIVDANFEKGYFGAFVAANQTPGFTVWMDEISLWNLP